MNDSPTLELDSPIIDIDVKELLSRGAEAEIWRVRWFGRDAVVKKRVKKGYRHPRLDDMIRKTRIKKEAKLMTMARSVGVPVPIIYDLRPEDKTMIIQYFNGPRVMDAIKGEADVDVRTIGEHIGRLHKAGISHGDLTTSNILFSPESGNLCFIDFSLGERESSIEDMGVDLHLMREALISVHEDPLELYDQILKGYKDIFDGAEETIERVKKIESRGRYQ
ncbi:MAG: KEOPS complex kinase/ATPase Bud32 [Candidatus Saliniplasma sp.]